MLSTPILLTAFLLGGQLPAAAGAAERIPCGNIREMAAGTLLRHGVLGRADVFDINGMLCSSDSDLHKCDWEHSIKELAILRPDSNTEVRLVETMANHKTGSGAWYSIVGFECRNGYVAKVFDEGFASVRFEAVSPSSFALTGLHAPPEKPKWVSRKRLYRWNPSTRAFVLE